MKREAQIIGKAKRGRLLVCVVDSSPEIRRESWQRLLSPTLGQLFGMLSQGNVVGYVSHRVSIPLSIVYSLRYEANCAGKTGRLLSRQKRGDVNTIGKLSANTSLDSPLVHLFCMSYRPSRWMFGIPSFSTARTKRVYRACIAIALNLSYAIHFLKMGFAPTNCNSAFFPRTHLGALSFGVSSGGEAS